MSMNCNELSTQNLRAQTTGKSHFKLYYRDKQYYACQVAFCDLGLLCNLIYIVGKKAGNLVVITCHYLGNHDIVIKGNLTKIHVWVILLSWVSKEYLCEFTII